MWRDGRCRAMRLLLTLALLPLAGCLADADACAPLPQSATVDSISGRDAHVRLEDGQPAVLHLPDVVHLEDGNCRAGEAADLRAGDVLTFEVDAWAESYPVQGWPERVVVQR
jgi:hypothetical protein